MPRGAVRRAHTAGDGDGRAVGAAHQPCDDVLRRDEAPPGDRAAACCTPRACCSSTSPPSASTRRRAARSGTTSPSSSATRTSRSSSPPTTWTRPSTATGSRSWTSGTIVALDTPQALKASVGVDRVQIQTDDDEAAIAALRERFGSRRASPKARSRSACPRASSSSRGCSPSSASRSARSTSRAPHWTMCSCPTRARRSATPRSPAHRHAAQHGPDDEPLMVPVRR